MQVRPKPAETADGGIAHSLVRAQLAKMLATETFARSERLGAFLSFVVEEAITGRGGSLKEQVIAAELYGKRFGFDPTNDPAVRVDARRLRDRIREYYAEYSRDPVIISLPKGGYIPVFERNASASPPAALSHSAPVGRHAEWRWPVVTALAGICAMAAGLLFLVARPGVEVAWQPVPLATLPGTEGPPSLSPDGNFVAFAWAGGTETGQTDIWVKAVGSESLRRLTETDAPESSPAWSPDGREIAFVRMREGVFIVSQLGGPERQISDSGIAVGWVPDGRSVVILDRVDKAPFGIWQVFLDSLTRRQITQPASGAGDSRFDVSPDGTTLAFIRYFAAGVADVFTVSMNGGEPQRQTNLATIMEGVAWTPDSREIIFSHRVGVANRLSRIPGHGSSTTRGMPVLLPVGANNPAISRPGKGRPARLAFQTSFADISLSLIDLSAPPEAGMMRHLKPLFDATVVDLPGSFSPDDSKVAFTSERSGRPQLWVGNRDGSGIRQLTSLESPNVGKSSWSPDGRRIAFEATIDGNTDLYSIDVNGGPIKRLTTESSIDRLPCWSRHDGWIYFSSDRSGREQIWKLPAEGGPPRQLTRQGGFEPMERWDGKFVYYLYGPTYPSSARAALKKVAMDGGEESAVLESIRPYKWGVTEGGIVFVSPRNTILTPNPGVDYDGIDLYSFSSRRVSRVGLLPVRLPWAGDIGRLAVSRNGRWAIINRVDRLHTTLMMVDNFR